jgi:hypothetical protein
MWENELVAFAEVKPDFFGYPFVELLIVGEAYHRRAFDMRSILKRAMQHANWRRIYHFYFTRWDLLI